MSLEEEADEIHLCIRETRCVTVSKTTDAEKSDSPFPLATRSSQSADGGFFNSVGPLWDSPCLVDGPAQKSRLT
jgi:hypothetical protein